MNRSTLIRLAAFAAACVSTAPLMWAQQPTIVASPTNLTFNLTAGTPPSQNITFTLANTTVPSATATVTASTGLRVNNQNSVNTVVPGTVFISVDPFVSPSVSGEIRVSVQGLPLLTIPVCFIRTTGGTPCPGGGTGTGNFQASVSSLQFTQTTTTAPTPAQFSLFSTTGVLPTYTTSVFYNTGTATNWLQVNPTPGFATNAQTVTVTPNTIGLGVGTYTATLTLTPQGGFNSISIPVTLTVGSGSGSTNFYANPASLVFNAASTTQAFSLLAATATSFSITASTGLAGLVQVTPVQGTAPTTIQVTVPNPSLIPANTVGFLTVTPLNSNYAAFTVPITINGTGSTTGSLVVSPQSLTFTTAPGASAPPVQQLNVTSSDLTTQVFTVSTSSANGALSATASSTSTPATVTVGVNPGVFTSAGTYTGSVTLTPTTGSTAGVAVSIPVTINVGTGSVLVATPSRVTLEGLAGSAGAVTGAVRLDLAAGLPANPVTTSVKTTTGGDWLSVTSPGFAPGQLTIRASAASLAAGTYEGVVTVTPTNLPPIEIPVTFTVTGTGELQVAPATLTFAYQTTASAAPASQTVQITSTGSPLTWNAIVTSTGGNWLTVTPATGTTGTNALTVSVNPAGLAAGTYNGTISVSSPNATGGARTIAVTLTVTTPVTPQITTFGNGGSYAASQASPGLIVTLLGTDLGPTTGVTAAPGASGFPTTLGETRVLFDGVAAPLLYSSATQVSAVVPFELAGRVTTRVQVEYRGNRSRETELRVADAAPGIFTTNQSGTGQGAVLNQNASVNGPQNPERRGNIVVIYATGLGTVSPVIPTGTAPSSISLTNLPVRVRIGGVDARVLYSGSAPGLVGGTYQVNAVIPESVTPGSAVPVVIEAGTGLSQPGVTIAVQ